MSYTNSTSNLHLPQWLASDKPNWDIDLNKAFLDIDNFAGEKNTGDAALSARINENSDSITALQGEVTSVQGEVATLTGRVGDLEQENDRQQSAIDKLNNDYTAMGETVASQGTRLTTAEGGIDTLEAQTAVNTGNIAALQKLNGLEVLYIDGASSIINGANPVIDFTINFSVPSGKKVVALIDASWYILELASGGMPSYCIQPLAYLEQRFHKVMVDAFNSPDIKQGGPLGGVTGFAVSQQLVTPPTTQTPVLNWISSNAFASHYTDSLNTFGITRSSDDVLKFRFAADGASGDSNPSGRIYNVSIAVLVKDA